MKMLDSILKVLRISLCESKDTYDAFKERIKGGAFSRDEDPQSHFCVYFLPYNFQNKKVFIAHHKKSGLWLSPGGHVDKEEVLSEALNREIGEELGIKNFFKEKPSPFLLTVTLISNQVALCKTHYDVWYLVPTDGSNFNIDPAEFYDTKWLTIEEARKKVIDKANIKALEIIEKL